MRTPLDIAKPGCDLPQEQLAPARLTYIRESARSADYRRLDSSAKAFDEAV